VRALRADRVQEGEKYALLHELVNLGNSLVQCRRVRRNIGLGQGQQVVADFSRKIDLARARLPNVGVNQATPKHENVCTFV
jgi:hypothetical protein